MSIYQNVVLANDLDTRPSFEAESPWERRALGSGAIFVILQLAALGYSIAFMFPEKPQPGAALAQHAAWYAQHGEVLITNNYLLVLVMPFFLFFLGGLYDALRRAEGGGSALTVAAVIAGAVMAIMWPLGCIMTNMGVTIARGGGDAATVWALDGMAPMTLALSALPRVIFLSATSIVLLQARQWPRWIGRLGLALAAISLIGSATLVLPSLFPLLGLGTLMFTLWILALSLALLKKI